MREWLDVVESFWIDDLTGGFATRAEAWTHLQELMTRPMFLDSDDGREWAREKYEKERAEFGHSPEAIAAQQQLVASPFNVGPVV